MKVSEMINEYKDAKDYDLQKHVVRSYLPYSMKIAIANRAIMATSYKEIGDVSVYCQDSPMMRLFFTIGLIEGYTDLIFDTNPLVEYDSLTESGILSHLLALIPASEQQLCEEILRMKKNDLMVNTRSVVSFLETKVESFDMLVKQLKEVFTPELMEQLQASIPSTER